MRGWGLDGLLCQGALFCPIKQYEINTVLHSKQEMFLVIRVCPHSQPRIAAPAHTHRHTHTHARSRMHICKHTLHNKKPSGRLAFVICKAFTGLVPPVLTPHAAGSYLKTCTDFTCNHFPVKMRRISSAACIDCFVTSTCD